MNSKLFSTIFGSILFNFLFITETGAVTCYDCSAIGEGKTYDCKSASKCVGTYCAFDIINTQGRTQVSKYCSEKAFPHSYQPCYVQQSADFINLSCQCNRTDFCHNLEEVNPWVVRAFGTENSIDKFVEIFPAASKTQSATIIKGPHFATLLLLIGIAAKSFLLYKFDA